MTQQELLHALSQLGGKATNRALLEKYLQIHKSSGQYYDDGKSELTIENQYYATRRKCVDNGNIIQVDQHIQHPTYSYYIQRFYYLPTHQDVLSYAEQNKILKIY